MAIGGDQSCSVSANHMIELLVTRTEGSNRDSLISRAQLIGANSGGTEFSPKVACRETTLEETFVAAKHCRLKTSPIKQVNESQQI